MQISRHLMVWAFFLVLAVGGYNAFMAYDDQLRSPVIAFSEFMDQVENKSIRYVVIQGPYVEGKTNDGQRFKTMTPPHFFSMVEYLKKNAVTFEAVPMESRMSGIVMQLLSWLPILLLAGVSIYFMRQIQGGGGRAMGFGKSKARLLTQKTKVTFEEVAGVDEARTELQEIVDFLKDPGKFQRLGGRIPRGCLLVGSPGTGKTLLARAIAGEANVPFFTISGSDFVEMFVGVGASRVRDMFEQAKKQAPCLLFIDEIDAVGRHRGKGFGGGNDEREQTLNQLLVEMDGFEANEGVIVIAATNRPDVLDPALLRPGRFDRQVEVPLPDLNGREQVLKVHMKKVPLGPDVDPRVIARGTPGFSGADLANLVNEGALLAARRNRLVVTMKDLEMAKDKVMMGAERRSFVMTDQERRLTAYHEGGHALVAYYSPAADPIHKATIIPRGRALGLVMQLPETDRVSLTRAKMKADLAVCMAGRVAEELIFGYEQVTSGASSDIRQASRMARAMVMEWGMTETVGPVFYGGEQTDMYLGGVNGPGNYAPTTGEKIDQAVKVFIEEGYQTAKRLLTEHQDALHHLAAALLEYESLTGKEIGDILQGRTIREDDGALHARALSKRLIPSVDEDGVVDEATAQSRDVSAEGDGEKSKKTESRGRRSGSKKEADTDQASS